MEVEKPRLATRGSLKFDLDDRRDQLLLYSQVESTFSRINRAAVTINNDFEDSIFCDSNESAGEVYMDQMSTDVHQAMHHRKLKSSLCPAMYV